MHFWTLDTFGYIWIRLDTLPHDLHIDFGYWIRLDTFGHVWTRLDTPVIFKQWRFIF